MRKLESGLLLASSLIIMALVITQQQHTASAFHAFNTQWGFTDRGFKQLLREDPKVNASIHYIEVKALKEIQNCERVTNTTDYDLQRICRNNMLYYTGLCQTHWYMFAFCNSSTLIEYLKENGYLKEGQQELQDVGTMLTSYIGSYKDAVGNNVENMTNRGGYDP